MTSPPDVTPTRSALFATSAPFPGCRRGVTLVELMVAFAVLLILFFMVVVFLNAAMRDWQTSERLLDATDRAGTALRMLESDLRNAASESPSDTGRPIVQFQARIRPDGNTGLMFVRSIEGGADRAFTGTAGDGRNNDANGSRKKQLTNLRSAIDTEDFNGIDDNGDGVIDNDLKPLGGRMAVAWFVDAGVLYRSKQAPVPANLDIDTFSDPSTATVMARSVLYFAVDFWTPFTGTDNWDGPLPRKLSSRQMKQSIYGSETQWDSTRGILAPDDFALAKTRASFQNPVDDVFPERVRITLTVDLEGSRAISTTLDNDVGASDRVIRAGDMTGFPPGGTPDAYVLIDDEWIYYERRTGNRITIPADGRGQRGTFPDTHSAGAAVRAGVQKMLIVDSPQFEAYRRGGRNDAYGDTRITLSSR